MYDFDFTGHDTYKMFSWSPMIIVTTVTIHLDFDLPLSMSVHPSGSDTEPDTDDEQSYWKATDFATQLVGLDELESSPSPSQVGPEVRQGIELLHAPVDLQDAEVCHS